MNIYPVEFSIVIVGQDCNPTILNPDFLLRHNIVPEDWGWRLAAPPITTSPFATVAYDSGVTVRVEVNRFQVTDCRAAEDIATSKASDIARRYIEVLPHVRYTAVGINFRSLIEIEDPNLLLKQRFLKSGPWDQEARCLQELSLTLAYRYDQGRFILSLESATVTLPMGDQLGQKRGVLASANFHLDCPDYPSMGQVTEHIGHATQDADYFQTTLTDLFTEVNQASTE